jgi:hypothetical protein
MTYPGLTNEHRRREIARHLRMLRRLERQPTTLPGVLASACRQAYRHEQRGARDLLRLLYGA